ncbi:MAG: aspartate 1-decarboxylase, partial [Thermodesulfobacteriota bacterium]
EGLMEMADLLPFEQVHVYNISNGKRFQTYVIKGKRNSGEICINGAAAWLARKGDLIIIASYATVTEEDARQFRPVLVYLDKDNMVTRRVTDA